jgi:hypothetical protein
MLLQAPLPSLECFYVALISMLLLVLVRVRVRCGWQALL